MRKLRCYECGKIYDFDLDDFCPKCGAFNQPKHQIRMNADGTVSRVQEPVIRKDGINERNHAGSFVHRELHQENRVRKGTALTKTAKQPSVRPSPVKTRTAGPIDSWKKKESGKTSPLESAKVFWWVAVAIILLRAFLSAIS